MTSDAAKVAPTAEADTVETHHKLGRHARDKAFFAQVCPVCATEMKS